MGWYTGQIAIFAATPAGWLRCDGSRLPVANNELLSSRVGSVYGEKDPHTFAVPMLPPLGPNGPFYCICIADKGNTLPDLTDAFVGTGQVLPEQRRDAELGAMRRQAPEHHGTR